MDILETSSVSMIVGLVERVSDLKYPDDIAHLDDDLGVEKSTFFNLIDDAERLGLVKVNEGNIELTPDGLKFVNSGIKDRKIILREKIEKLEPFKTALEILRNSPEGKMQLDDFMEIFKKKFYSYDLNNLLRVLVNWGRYVKLIGYSMDSNEIYLYRES